MMNIMDLDVGLDGSAEQIIKKLLAEQLSMESMSGINIALHDSFEELGVSSLQKILIYPRLLDLGINLLPAEFVDTKTIADLISLCESAFFIEKKEGAQSYAGGTEDNFCARFLPGQQWFLSENFPEINRFNISIAYESTQSIDPQKLAAAVRHVLFRHIELRKKYIFDGNEWSDCLLNVDDIIDPLLVVNLPGDESFEEGYAKACDDAQLEINIFNGSLIKFILIKSPANLVDRLVLIGHHLALDGFSLRIINEDLWESYKTQDSKLQNFDSGFSKKDILQKIEKYTSNPDVKKRINFWTYELIDSLRLLPSADRLDGNNKNSCSQVKTYIFNEDETRKISTVMPQKIGVNANQLLVAALYSGLIAWTGDVNQLILNIDAARTFAFKSLGVDVSKQVCWLTMTTPLYFDKPMPLESLEDLLKIKASLVDISDRGIAYEIATAIKDLAVPKIPSNKKVVFNFLGDMHEKYEIDDSNDFFVQKNNSYAGNGFGLSNDRACVFLINSEIIHNKLVINWIYNGLVHQEHEIDELLQNMIRFVYKAVSFLSND